MGNRPRKVEKTRINVTLTRLYLDALDCFVEEGIYLSKAEIILEALRRLLRSYGMGPFRPRERPFEEGDEEAGCSG